ncbi:hypothetical protein [Salmonella phage LVR16A]|uniref:HNH endonuclease n=1 Tax=Salmonella phage LVR16A TaxID=2041204 RepID=A0A291LCV3_9CAUD|nr:HNH endonuclease [Salmonella phage LVR16A]ATI16609.1 hypothetical protein [Salmonella phage LVR16A]WDR21989.1 hypothetical protein PJM43_0062 [Salmonella phage vB_SenS_UTK0008]
MNETKVCPDCSVEYPLTTEYFYANGTQASGRKKWKAACKSCDLSRRKRKTEEVILEVFPSLSCEVCGYSKCKAALDFHHLDPSEKDFNLARITSTNMAKDKVIAELRKCVLLCSNCHREHHAGFLELNGRSIQRLALDSDLKSVDRSDTV